MATRVLMMAPRKALLVSSPSVNVEKESNSTLTHSLKLSKKSLSPEFRLFLYRSNRSSTKSFWFTKRAAASTSFANCIARFSVGSASLASEKKIFSNVSSTTFLIISESLTRFINSTHVGITSGWSAGCWTKILLRIQIAFRLTIIEVSATRPRTTLMNPGRISAANAALGPLRSASSFSSASSPLSSSSASWVLASNRPSRSRLICRTKALSSKLLTWITYSTDGSLTRLTSASMTIPKDLIALFRSVAIADAVLVTSAVNTAFLAAVIASDTSCL
mmetsp:Transcript_6687/g.14431  ORF Transcript_6687/g.14431 Transcript_6687/m.14431 type:complete len:277 (+) Transcript_6687:2292-3122(+)